MKKYLKNIFAIALVFGMAIALIGCGDKDDNTSNETSKSESTGSKSWPTASFIPSGIEYTGSGEIVSATQNESSTRKNAIVYYSNANLEDVIQYVDMLKTKGLTKENPYVEEQTGFNEYGSYTWTGVNSDSTFSISISLNDEDTTNSDFTYNLLITMLNESIYE